MHKHLQKINDHTFDKIFNQQIGFLLLKDYCNSVCDEPVPQVKFYEEVTLLFVSFKSSLSLICLK